jgi:DNA-binding NtrC family response regulator
MIIKPRILFLDDEERIVNLLRIMFRSTHEVFTATNGHEALKLITQHQIHVVVSDQRMPEMTGIEFLSQVRERSPGTMRILLTGYSDLTAIVGSVNDGEVFRFINKPWDQDEIKSIIAEASEIALSTWNTSPGSIQFNMPIGLPVHTHAPKPRLLVIDEDFNDRHWVTQLFTKDYEVSNAGSIAEALKVLASQDVGVIISEATVNGEDSGMLLKILKREYPMITTVMLTSTGDSDLVIKLINQAQIYRFATKPIRKSVLELAVSAAMRQHERLRVDPVLRSRHKVAKATDDEDTSPLAQSIVKGLAGLRARFSLFSRPH